MSTGYVSQDIFRDLNELKTHLGTLSARLRSKLLPLVDRVEQGLHLQSNLVRRAQDAVEQLHLDVKYLLFDVEASRRERDALREELNRRSEQ